MQLPIPPKIGVGPIRNLKLSWGDNPEINVRVMLNPGANVPVLCQSLVGEHEVPVVLWERAENIAGYNGAAGKGAVTAQQNHQRSLNVKRRDHQKLLAMTQPTTLGMT